VFSSQEVGSSQEQQQPPQQKQEKQQQQKQEKQQQPPQQKQEKQQKDQQPSKQWQLQQQQQQQQQQPKDVVDWVDSSRLVMVRISAGVKMESPLVAGSGGFCIAQFGSETIQTEVPNLMLKPIVLKKPAARKARTTADCSEENEDEGSEKEGEGSEKENEGNKKEVADDEEKGEEEEKEMEEEEHGKGDEEDDEEVCPPEKRARVEQEDVTGPVKRKYYKMWYKRGGSWGVRRGFGDKAQIFAVGGKKARGVSKETMGTIVDMVIQKMEQEDLPETAAKELAWNEVFKVA